MWCTVRMAGDGTLSALSRPPVTSSAMKHKAAAITAASCHAPRPADRPSRWIVTARNTIAAGLAEGLVKPYPIDLIGGFLYAGIVATTDFIRGQGDRTDRAALIEMGFEIFWDGIKAAAGD